MTKINIDTNIVRHFMKNFFILSFLTLLISLIAYNVYAQDKSDKKIVIGGSSTVYNFFFKDNEKLVEEKTGIDLDVVLSSSGRGVLGLVDGEHDIATVSSDFDMIVSKINDNEGRNLNPDDYQIDEISRTEAIFVVHPDNPVKELTKEQVSDIFTGKVRNWDELGVSGLGKIRVVTEHPTGGIYNLVIDKVTQGQAICDSKLVMQNAPQIAIVVSQTPGGFGMFSEATPEDQRRGVKASEIPGFEVIQNMAFVTKKNDTRQEIRDIIEAVQKHTK